VIRLGSAGAPRWYDLSMERLDVYVESLVAWGATGMELVLHHGPADDRVARVHVLDDDRERVVARYLAAGLRLDVHNSLDARFHVDRWRSDPEGLMADAGPLLDAAAAIAERQGAPVAFVVHGARPTLVDDGREATLGYLDWAGRRMATTGVTVALELRRQIDPANPGADGSRAALVETVRRAGSDHAGICWDLGHDWENGLRDPGWRPEPEEDFLSLVTHVHAHDAGPEGQVHFPLTLHRVPFARQFALLAANDYAGSVTMEVRWRYAASLGSPWDLMAASYENARPLLGLDGTKTGDDGPSIIREAS
jgi:sugar phosphate isomerase/epimerase